MSSPETSAAEPEPHPPLSVIDTRAAYLAAVDEMAAGSGPVAVDAERASGFRYSQRAYLIQMFRRGAGTFLFDPPAIGSFAELDSAIKHEEWVLHAASQDLACLREVGLDPQRIFDTELAARLLGIPKVGLASVVQELLGVTLAKEHSAADWSTRPLPQSWLVYAALDVELLVDLRDAIQSRLDEHGKDTIAKQEFEAVLSREAKTPRSEPWRRLSGVHGIRGGRNLAVARELWLARDELARETDTAPGRLIPDTSIVAVAKRPPESKQSLAAMRDFSGRTSRSQLDRWWAAVEAGLTSRELPVARPAGDSIPPPRSWSDRNPEADARLKAARRELAEVAGTLDLPVENLLTPEYLRRVSWQPPDPLTPEALNTTLAELGARPWQLEATVQPIMRAFVDASQPPEEQPEAAS